MSRIRSIKPEFGQNEKLSALHPETHLLAALLLPYADDEGYFNANPKLVQAAVFPLRELLQSVPEMLRSLTEINYLETCVASDGRHYGRIVNFAEHQRVSHPTNSKIKPLWKSPEEFGIVPEPIRPEWNGIEGKGREELQEPIPELIQHPLNYARKMIEVLGLSERILRSVEAGLMAECRLTGNGLDECSQFIVHRAMEDRASGVSIDKFYFDDTKWRNGNGANKSNGIKPSRQVERAFGNIGAVAVVFGGSDSATPEDGCSAVEYPRLGDGAGQKARPRPAQPPILEGEVKRYS